MNLETLIQLLCEYRDEHGPEAEVRLMTQQNWPFENHVAGITSGSEMNEDDEEMDDHDVEDDSTIYIVEGGQIGYGSKRAWETCRDC